MEAIHPKAAKPMELAGIAIRLKNTFEPDHPGTAHHQGLRRQAGAHRGHRRLAQGDRVEIHDPLMVGTVGFDSA